MKKLLIILFFIPLIGLAQKRDPDVDYLLTQIIVLKTIIGQNDAKLTTYKNLNETEKTALKGKIIALENRVTALEGTIFLLELRTKASEDSVSKFETITIDTSGLLKFKNRVLSAPKPQ